MIITVKPDPQAGSFPAATGSTLSRPGSSTARLASPATSPTSRKKKWPFEVELPDELQTYGFVLADQLRAIDFSVRSATYVESAPSEFIDEILRKISTLVK